MSLLNGEAMCPRCGIDRSVEDLGDDDCPKPCWLCMKCDLTERIPWRK